MQPEQIREARSCGIEARYDCPVRWSQFCVASENFKCLHRSFFELHTSQPAITGRATQVLIGMLAPEHRVWFNPCCEHFMEEPDDVPYKGNRRYRVAQHRIRRQQMG